MPSRKTGLTNDRRPALSRHYACPDCGVPMNGVDGGHGKIVWVCPAAVGEQYIDPATRRHVMPVSDPHTTVVHYTAERLAVLIAKGLSHETGPNFTSATVAPETQSYE